MDRRDYTSEAKALFLAFAERHDLSHCIVEGAPVELMLEFPVQPKLSMPLILALQNCDELNFGVGDFWSYFFPFNKVEDKFVGIIDAWVLNKARVAVTGRRGRLLQVSEAGRWTNVYAANRFWPYWGHPKVTYSNAGYDPPRSG